MNLEKLQEPQSLRLAMGELDANELLVAQAAVRYAYFHLARQPEVSEEDVGCAFVAMDSVFRANGFPSELTEGDKKLAKWFAILKKEREEEARQMSLEVGRE